MNPIVILILAAAVAMFFLLSKRGKNSAPSPNVTGGWIIGPIDDHGENHSIGMPERPTLQGVYGWAFAFPAPAGKVDAVENLSPQALPSIPILRYAVTGGGFRAPEIDAKGNAVTAPGRVGFYIQRKGDDWSGKGKYQQYRLYSQSRPLLVAGEGSLAVTAWIDVEGKLVDQSVVDAVMADLAAYGVCFGGSFASHGVYAEQPSTFTLLAPIEITGS